jgi:hypothetical protein
MQVDYVLVRNRPLLPVLPVCNLPLNVTLRGTFMHQSSASVAFVTSGRAAQMLYKNTTCTAL